MPLQRAHRGQAGRARGTSGSTFSSLDLVAHLLLEELNVAEVGFELAGPGRVLLLEGPRRPGLYAALNALGVIPTERLLRLRRLGGLDGHPDVGVPGIEANSGSLGMGISKARGIAWAKRHLGRGGRVVVMTGDGELQEGQNWEALQAAAHQRVGRLLGRRRPERAPVGPADRGDPRAREPRGEARGVRLARRHLRRPRPRRAARRLREAPGRAEDGTPEVARRAHGQGEGRLVHGASRALAEGGGTYRWHAGAPDDEAFAARGRRARERIARRRRGARARRRRLEPVPPLEEARARASRASPRAAPGTRPARVTRRGAAEYVAAAYGEALLELAAREPRLVVLDADLASDCRVRAFELAVPGPVRRERHRGAGHGLDGGGHGAARAPPGRQLVRELPRLARERADLQPGERAHEGRLRDALRGADPRRARQVAPEPARRLAPGSDPGRHRRPSLQRGGDAGARRVGRARGAESVAIRLAIGPSPRRIELPAGYRPVPGVGAPCARAATRCSSRTGR